jgi:hypothetical protein
MLKSVQVLTKVKVGWGERSESASRMAVDVKAMAKEEGRLMRMSLSELLFFALIGDGRA